jgi:hypothetical protein
MQTVIIMSIGLGLFLLGFFQRRKVSASRSWPATTGQISAGRVEVTHNRGDEDTADSITYTPVVQYQYWTGNQWLYGDRIGFVGRGFSTQRQAQAVLANYPVGATVTVYFNPAKPAQAVLERTAAGGMLLVVLGGVIVLLGIAALVHR